MNAWSLACARCQGCYGMTGTRWTAWNQLKIRSCALASKPPAVHRVTFAGPRENAFAFAASKSVPTHCLIKRWQSHPRVQEFRCRGIGGGNQQLTVVQQGIEHVGRCIDIGGAFTQKALNAKWAAPFQGQPIGSWREPCDRPLRGGFDRYAFTAVCNRSQRSFPEWVRPGFRAASCWTRCSPGSP